MMEKRTKLHSVSGAPPKRGRNSDHSDLDADDLAKPTRQSHTQDHPVVNLHFDQNGERTRRAR